MDEHQVSKRLEERIKELNTLYRTSKIITQSKGDLKGTLKRIAEVIPTGWQYPEICTCRITLGDVVATSSRFKEGEWKQSEEIFLHGKKVGLIEVFYLSERPEADEGPFLLEERNLIIELCDRISEFLKILESQRELDDVRKRYDLLFGEDDEAIIYLELDQGLVPTGISFCNVNTEKMLGYHYKDIVGMQIYDLMRSDQGEVLETLLKDPCPERKRDKELVMLKKDGSEIKCPVEVNIIRLSGKNGALLILKD